MKKLIFLISALMFLNLSGSGNSVWTPQPDWLTGPETELDFYENQMTYLLPFGLKVSTGNCWEPYIDENPVLYQTDMGWPVPNSPDESTRELKYLIFGDTHFFRRNNDGQIMNTITDENNIQEQIFNVSDSFPVKAEISVHPLSQYLTASGLLYPMSFFAEQECVENNCEIYPHDDDDENNDEDLYYECSQNCRFSEFGVIYPSYNECLTACDSDLLDNVNAESSECETFCKYAMIEAHTFMDYFAYSNLSDESKTACNAEDAAIFDTAFYNNGTSNLFLAASLEIAQENGKYIYKVKFENTDETGGTSHQLYETKSGNQRKSKSVWMSDFERSVDGFAGIYTGGYFYACAGSPSGTCATKKLFIPYGFGNWDFSDKLLSNIVKDILRNEGISDDDENYEAAFKEAVLEVLSLSGQDLFEKIEEQTQKYGFGIYDFNQECRVNFSSNNGSSLNCPKLSGRPECYSGGFSNPNILWAMGSKMLNTTVVHGMDIDPLSFDAEFDKYIYFIGTAELAIGDTSNLNWSNIKDVAFKTQKAYIARVPAYESEIKCASSYEYFTGIYNGKSNWSKNIDAARSLYNFYPLNQMSSESIIKHKGLYWMTAPLNESKVNETASGTDEKGVVILASPDGFHWQKMDKILFDNPESIDVDYAFFWLPSELINENDNTMPFLYSIWKSHYDTHNIEYNDVTGYSWVYEKIDFHLKGFLDPDLDPKFTHYNLKMGRYNFMRDNKTGTFLVNSSYYGSLLSNNIPESFETGLDKNGDISIKLFNVNNGFVYLPFNGFQNIEQIGLSGQNAENLRKRYVMVQYCDCLEQDEDLCKNKDLGGNCSPYNVFMDSNGNAGGNWEIIDIAEDYNFKTNVKPCGRKAANDPDYMCDIPFEHKETLPTGITSTPVWKWREQIAKERHVTIGAINEANVILRFSHWYGMEFLQNNFTEINAQLVENNKLVPYDCGLSSTTEAACKKPESWRTTSLIRMKYELEMNSDLGSGRIEYLYPYPFVAGGFGGPGDPYGLGRIFTTDHLTGNFYNTGLIDYGSDVAGTLPPGFAMTAVMNESSMNVYAWGGMSSSMVLLNGGSSQIAPERILFSGTFDAETETIVLEQSLLTETAGDNSPSMTEGTSMVYDNINGKIYLIGAFDKTGVSRIYRLDNITGGQAFAQGWVPITEIDSGRFFRLVKKSGREYFVVGGIKTDGSFSTKVFLLNLDNISSPQLLTNIPESGLANSFTAYNEKNGKLYIFGGVDSNGASNRFLSFNTRNSSWSSINSVSGPGAASGGVLLVNYVNDTIFLGGGKFENPADSFVTWGFDEESTIWTKQNKNLELPYCLNETDNIVKGGLEISGECMPFTHPWYRLFATGSTIYSVAGKGDRLYVGTNNSIKVYDISDPNAFVLKSTFSTGSRRVYDLEVAENDIMYAATSGGIYKLNTANPDTLASLSFFATSYNYQYRIQLYNDKLYVGDDNGINIRHKDTFARLAYVNIDSVLDFAIANGEIALYRSSFWSAGLHIRDVETLNLKAYEYAECYTGELTTDHGAFYLSCDGYEYRFEGRPDTYFNYYPLDGDIREMQENHVHNGWTYIYDGSNVKLSTLNDVPSYCGNGVIEPGELCDGNSVACTTISSSYVSGTAYCNSTCNGYNESNCSTDGW